jgi:hypothetical protein
MVETGRKLERTLNVFGRYMRIACKRKAKALGIKRYSWQRLSEEAGTHPTMILKAISGDSKPEQKNVWKWIDVLQPDAELERLICHSLGYSTRQEVAEAESRIGAMEQAEGIQ